MSFAQGFPLILLAFALVFAVLKTWKAPETPHCDWGWLSIAILIFVEIFYHGQGVFK